MRSDEKLHPLSNKEQRVQLHSLWCDFSKQNVDVVLTGVDDTANRNDFRFNAVERDIAFDHQHTQVSFIAGLCPNGNASGNCLSWAQPSRMAFVIRFAAVGL